MKLLKKIAAVLGFFILPVVGWAAYSGSVTWRIDTSSPIKIGVNISGVDYDFAFFANGRFVVASTTVDATRYFTTAQLSDISTGSPTLDLKTAIQQAENALGSAGGTLYFPPGTYRWDSIVYLSSNVHVKCSGTGATVFKPIYNFTMFGNDVLASRNLSNDTTPATEANQPDHDISVEGCTFDMRATTGVASPSPINAGDVATPVRFYYMRNCSVTNSEIIGLDEPVLSGSSWIGSSGEYVGQGVDGCRFSNNKMHGSLLAVDVWQGSRNVWIENNDIVLSNNETAHRPNSYCIGVNARGTLPEDHKPMENIFVRDNRCVAGGWATGGVEFDTLSAGSTSKKITIDNNVIVGRSGGTNQQGIYGRGRLEDISITNNKIEGVQNFPILVADQFSTGGPFTCTDCITTTNGSKNAVVAISTLTAAKVSVDNYLLFSSGTGAVGGITFASKYFKVVAVNPGVSATVEADVPASSTAGPLGGSVSVSVYWGAPNRLTIAGNSLLNSDYANTGLITAVGQNISLTSNKATGGTYGAVTNASTLVAGSIRTPLPVVNGTQGAAGTGIAGTGGNNIDNYPAQRHPITAFPSIAMACGTAPSSPIDGQMWCTTANVFARINGATQTLAALNSQNFAGIGFGSVAASSPTDLSKHIALYSTTYGFAVTSFRMNYNAPLNAAHMFLANGVDIAQIDASGLHIPVGSLSTNIATKTTDYAATTADSSLIFNCGATCTITLPAASSRVGHTITVRTIAAQTVVSASSNVVPLAGGVAGTAILAATAGKWADLQSDGTNWQIMRAN